MRTFAWYGNGRTVRGQGEHPQDAFTRLSKEDREHATHADRCYEIVIRYAITHVNRDGYRTLTFANQGRNHYDTRDAAERRMKLVAPSLREKVLGDDMADTLAVRPFECYDHGDAIGIFYRGPVDRRVDELGGYVVADGKGAHEANFIDMKTADAFARWMGETKRACSTVWSGHKRYAVTYSAKLDLDQE